MGRNSAFDHAGNVASRPWPAPWVGRCRAGGLPAGARVRSTRRAAVLTIPAAAIDHERARGADGNRAGGAPASLRTVLGGCRPAHLWMLRLAVPSRQRAAAAAGRAEIGRRAQGFRHGDDVGLHHRRAVDHAADRAAGRTHRRPCRAQADLARRVCRPADPRRALHLVGPEPVADRRCSCWTASAPGSSGRSTRW